MDQNYPYLIRVLGQLFVRLCFTGTVKGGADDGLHAPHIDATVLPARQKETAAGSEAEAGDGLVVVADDRQSAATLQTIHMEGFFDRWADRET